MYADYNLPDNAVICPDCKTLFTADDGIGGNDIEFKYCPVCGYTNDYDDDDDDDEDDNNGGYGGINTPLWDAEIVIEPGYMGPKKKKEKEEKRVRGRLLDLS